MKNKHWDRLIKLSRKYDSDVIKVCRYIWPISTIETANDYEDMKHNTDFFVYRDGLEPLRIAARIRTYPDYLKYPDDITFRDSLALNGVPHDGDTEWQKIQEGWGDFDIYAFQTENEQHLFHIAVIDLDRLRRIEKAHGFDNCWKFNYAHDTGCGFRIISRQDLGLCIIEEFEKIADKWIEVI